MINPILATSARQRMRSIRTPVIVTVYALLQLAFVLFYSFDVFGHSVFYIQALRRSVEGYVYLLVLQFIMLVLVAPAMTAGSISGERERQTLDLLRVTNTSSVSIVLGKLLESFGFLCLLIFSSLPMLGLILLTGGVTLGQILIAVLFLMLSALEALSIGLFCSAMFRRTVTSTVAAYLGVFAIGAITLVPIFWDTQAIGDIYTTANNANVTLTTINYFPLSFVLNPALGLFSLIVEQTKLLQSTLGSVSHTLNVTFQYLPFGSYVLWNMIAMVVGSLLLLTLSSLRVRYRKQDRPRMRRGKK